MSEAFQKAQTIISNHLQTDGLLHKIARGEAGDRGDTLAGTIAGAMLAYSNECADLGETEIAIDVAKSSKVPKDRYLADRALRILFMHLTVKEKPCPAILSKYIATQILLTEAPKYPSKAKEGNARDSLLCWTIQQAVDETGLPATRGDNDPELSCCDALAKVLPKIDPDNALKYKQLKAVWAKRNELSCRPSALWRS